MNLMRKPPLGLKRERPAKNAAYLERVRALPCCICHEYGLPQLSPTEAHHVICGRGGNLKTPDIMSIPLCHGHHSGDFDTSKIAIHRQREAWVAEYGPDTDWTSWTQERLGI